MSRYNKFIRRTISAFSKVKKDRRDRYPDDWRTRAKKRVVIDGKKCRRCGSFNNLQVHHITPLSKGGSNALINLITLCSRCHDSRHRSSHLRLKRY